MSRDVIVAGVGMIPFTKPGASEAYNVMGAKAARRALDDAGVDYALIEQAYVDGWLTGVLEQASGTAYSNRPADDPDILKGIAGSPYAIKDYFDVCPDYAVNPDERLVEFKELLVRCHAYGFKVVIGTRFDFPNTRTELHGPWFIQFKVTRRSPEFRSSIPVPRHRVAAVTIGTEF